MEQPPGSIDDLQPQDLSMSSRTSVIDLTKKGEGCIHSEIASVDALQLVSNTSWCANSDASNPGLASDILVQPGEDHIRPDVALSHTTVTVSYVSRSHVFSSHNSVSQHLPLCGVSAISKLPLNPPVDSDSRHLETGVTLDQHYSKTVDGPVDLATQTELFQTSSQAQVGPENFGSHLTQDTNEVNGGVAFPDWDADEHAFARGQHSLPQGEAKGLENGQINRCSSLGVCAESSPQTLAPAAGEDQDTGGAEGPFLVSKTKDSVVLPDSQAARDLCSQKKYYKSPLEDPVSPSPTSQDDVEDVFVLPQASNSPSGEYTYLPDEAACDGVDARGAIFPDSNKSGSAGRFKCCNEDTESVHQHSAPSVPVIDLTDDGCSSNNVEIKTATCHMNGDAETLQRSSEGEKLPVRSGRGTRSKAAAVDVNSNGWKVSEHVCTSREANSPTFSNSKFTNDERYDSPPERNRARKAKVSDSADQAAKVQVKRGNADNTSTDNHRDSTSDSEANNSIKLPSSTPPKSPRLAPQQNFHPQPERLPTPLEQSAKCSSSPPPAKSPNRSRGGAKGRSAGRKTPPTAKRKNTGSPKKRRRRRKPTPTSNMFSPKEPEIKLRYVNFKEEKRESRVDSFSPFVHVERRPQQQPSLCTVVNYPEEVRGAAQPRRDQPSQPGGFVSTIVPSTSCMQLGRVTVHSQHRRVLVCCLCGLSANAMDLGDLHGPYYPEGFQPAPKAGAASSEGLRGEQGYEDDDSDASSHSIRTRRRKQAVPPRPQRSGVPRKARGLRVKRRQSVDGPGTSPTKRARPDAGASGPSSSEDWYSAPLLPAELCEFWLHEDCGIWSTGVFLVRGRVYGLEEAVRTAQDTTCSACRHPGATLGCFFKSCPNKYHYRCALESDCVLIEENFSMKCKKHKNKTFKAPPGNRLDDR